MIISEYKGQRVIIDLINGLIHPLFLIRRVLQSGSKAATPSEYKIRKQVAEITEKISPGKAPGARMAAPLRYVYQVSQRTLSLLTIINIAISNSCEIRGENLKIFEFVLLCRVT